MDKMPFFFQNTWDITVPLVLAAIQDFFATGKLLKQLNTTIITLIPKVPSASKMGEYRPIACCNTIYKCISMVLAQRLKQILPNLVDETQSAFVASRRISDNILQKVSRESASSPSL